MVKPLVESEKLVDLSFMPSLQCDLSCGHCMYNSSPTNTASLDLVQTRLFTKTVDWDVINSCGFYGGEPGINLPLYAEFINLVPKSTPRFTITDGTWSRTQGRTAKFVEWALEHNLQVFVSSTPYHLPYQNLDILLEVCEKYHSFTIKGDDTIIPMGRMAKDGWTCGFKCRSFTGPVRFAVTPGGNIIFQSCDGVYPVVGTYKKSFDNLLKVYESVVARCQQMRV